MPWSGYPETMVSQLTFTEWVFSLRAHREVQIGYSIRVADFWELFGDDRWVWFTGAVASKEGAVQIVSQWAEWEPLGPRERVWQWVHWKNPSNDDIVVKPFLLLAPPIDQGWLTQSQATTAHRAVWTLGDRATSRVSAVVTALPDPGGDSGGGGGAGSGGAGGGRGGREGRDLQLTVAARPLEGQHMRKAELRGDLRYLPPEELWRRLDQSRPPRATRAAAGRRPAGSAVRRGGSRGKR